MKQDNIYIIYLEYPDTDRQSRLMAFKCLLGNFSWLMSKYKVSHGMMK